MNMTLFLVAVLSAILSTAAMASEKYPQDFTCKRALPKTSSYLPKVINVTGFGTKETTLEGREAYTNVSTRDGQEVKSLEASANGTDKVRVSAFWESHDAAELNFFTGDMISSAAAKAKGKNEPFYSTYISITEYGDESLDSIGVYECQ